MTILLSDLQLWPWPSTFQMNSCAKLFWNPSINVKVMALTSSIYDHFIIWPSSVTLTFNLPQQLFQMNNCARLLLSFDLQVWLSTYLNKWFKWTITVCQIILKSMHNCRSYGPDRLNLWPFYNLTVTSSIYDQPIIWLLSVTLTFNLTEQMFQMALLFIKENNCAKLFWNPCINVEVMARTSYVSLTTRQ